MKLQIRVLISIHKFEMSGNKSKSDKAQKKETKLEEQLSNKQTDKYSGDVSKSKSDSVVASDGGAHNIYFKEKKGMEHTYYIERRTLTEAKIKQDSYSEVKQYYSRDDKNVGTGIPRVREITPRRDEVITTTREGVNQGVAQASNDLPPDYSSLFSGQDGEQPS